MFYDPPPPFCLFWVFLPLFRARSLFFFSGGKSPPPPMLRFGKMALQSENLFPAPPLLSFSVVFPHFFTVRRTAYSTSATRPARNPASFFSILLFLYRKAQETTPGKTSLRPISFPVFSPLPLTRGISAFFNAFDFGYLPNATSPQSYF